jgi:hypothetical protein
MATTKVAPVTEPELREKSSESREKKEMSLIIQILESDLYDYDPAKRFLLVILAHGQRVNEKAYIPDDMPDEFKEDKCLGWCDMAQWRLSLRVGQSESQINRNIQQFRKYGVIQTRGWEDDDGMQHVMYRVVPEVVKDHQRPSQKKSVERKPRYAKKAASRGHFTAKIQPKKLSMAAVAEEDEL